MKQYVQKLQERLQWAYEIAQEHIEKDVNRRKLYYDRKVNCMEIIPGDIVLVRQKVFGTQHKIEDRWELPVYKVLEQCGGRPTIQSSEDRWDWRRRSKSSTQKHALSLCWSKGDG